eukprot:1683565-Prymnesium_polylepis.1
MTNVSVKRSQHCECESDGAKSNVRVKGRERRAESRGAVGREQGRERGFFFSGAWPCAWQRRARGGGRSAARVQDACRARPPRVAPSSWCQTAGICTSSPLRATAPSGRGCRAARPSSASSRIG